MLLHADPLRLYCRTYRGGTEHIESHALIDLGLSTLLELHDLQLRSNPAVVHPLLKETLKDLATDPAVLQGVSFDGVSDLPSFDLAYERRGWLFLLSYVEGQGEEAKEAVRRLTLVKDRLNGLQPVITVMASSESVRERAAAAGFQVLRSGDPLGWAIALALSKCLASRLHPLPWPDQPTFEFPTPAAACG